MLLRRPLPYALTALLLVSGATACSSADGGGGATGRVQVAAAFYPLEYLAERIGGDDVTVVGLTKPGAEPHDTELTPPQVAELTRTTVLFYERGMQGSVDDAVERIGAERVFDVAPAADLSLEAAEPEGEHADEDGHDHEARDPHFWLDPTRYAKVAEAMGAELGKRDPANAARYTERTTALVADLTALDEQFRTGLATCASKDLVTSHAAFAYLADRYGLRQVPIAGVSPDIEPDAAAMKGIVATIRSERVSTIYSETIASPALAQTIAKETGAKVAVLDPVEGVTSESAGPDYLAIMKANLATLVQGQECR